MSNKKNFLVIYNLLIIVIVAYWFKGQIAIDKCLDSGGRWNYDKGICEYKEIKNIPEK